MFHGHVEKVVSAIALSDKYLVSCSADKTLRIWHTMTGECLRVLKGHSYEVSLVIALPDGRLVSCSDDDYFLRIWNIIAGECDRILKGHSAMVRSVVALSDGRLVSCSNDNSLRIWNIESGECDHILEGHESAVSSVVVLPNGRLVSCSDDKSLRIWDIMSAECVHVLDGHSDVVRAVVALPNSRLVSCSDDSSLRIWNIESGKCVKTLSSHKAESIMVISQNDFITRDNVDVCYLWSVDGVDFRRQLITIAEYIKCLDGKCTAYGVQLGKVAPGFSASKNYVFSRTFGRSFVDESVDWVVNVDSTIAVFQKNGRDHWFKESTHDIQVKNYFVIINCSQYNAILLLFNLEIRQSGQ